MSMEEQDDGMAAIIAANPVEETGEDVEVEQQDTSKEDALELTDEDEAVDVEEDEEGGEEDETDEGKRRRSKPASVRIAELTAKLREAERQLEGRDQKPEPKADEEPVEPKPDDYEYGEADPAYIRAIAKYDRDVERHEEGKGKAEQQQRQQMVDKISNSLAQAETAAKAKYEDFDAKIEAAVAARGGEPLPPLLSVGLGISPVGGDLIYRLATDETASERLETLARGGQATSKQMAMALGELEGEYLIDVSDTDLDMSDELDMMRAMGRMRARVAGKQAPERKTVTSTNAPPPPKHNVRGGAGKFEVGADTTDFAAFEKKANAKK